MTMATLDLSAFAKTPLQSAPYPHLIVPGFVRAAALDGVNADFPAIAEAGSVPPSELDYGPRFAAFLAELEGVAFRAACAAKFDLDLTGRPTLVTVRGRVRAGDGKIHTDTASKLITVLIYLNPAWEAAGGRLRVLRGPQRLPDFATHAP